MPDKYLKDENQVDLIVGQPLLFNYYSIFDIYNQRVGFYKASYSLSETTVTAGATICIIFFSLVSLAGVFACYKKSKALKEENQVKARPRSDYNQQKYEEEVIGYDQDLVETDEKMVSDDCKEEAAAGVTLIE